MPLQPSAPPSAAVTELATAEAYEKHKMDDRDTARRCEQLGLKLIPMVVEALGGWGPQAQKAFKTIVQAHAMRTGVESSVAASRLYEGLAVRLQRANARALLSRQTAFNTTAVAPSLVRSAAVLASAASPTADMEA